MKRLSTPWAAGAAAALLPPLLQAPAHAHATSGSGALSGLLHPLLGVDHLLMLVAVGVAAAVLSPALLLWALAGAVAGSLLGVAGLQLPGLEGMALLAVLAVAGWTALAPRLTVRHAWVGSRPRFSGALVAAAVMIHGLLHGLEAPAGAGGLAWWAGALLASIAIAGGTTVLLRRLPVAASLAASPQGARRPSQ
ncbi:MAG: HupE/UreJ family protein [Vulcanococcus sp.]